ncbi:Aste57867_9420 [Aphanomyces stellatus]|uniref:Aste57867_9420 protein n=1 Tax=Aphanomyces stellatus TaxID=120398 RepID=A0A485KMZ3_9STRA|nr:hypothetical protein As57867_009384 [Aphanomyces stellatus]VFT86300.1 Aste57867_9420 [Aphanomyces stellatus]
MEAVDLATKATRKAVPANVPAPAEALARRVCSIMTIYFLYRAYAYFNVHLYPFGEVLLSTPPLPTPLLACPYNFALLSPSFVQVQDASDAHPSQVFVMGNGQNEGKYITWASSGAPEQGNLSSCPRELASFAARALGAKGFDLRNPSLYSPMGWQLMTWNDIEASPHLHVLFDQELWVWPGVRVGYEWYVDGIHMKTLSLSPKTIFVSDVLAPRECDDLIALGIDKMNPSPVVSNKTILQRTRTSSTAFIGHLPLGQTIKSRGTRLARLPSPDYAEDIQLVRYEAGQLYKLHKDYFTHVSVGDPHANVVGQSLTYWIQWAQKNAILSTSHPLYPRHSAAFELALARLLLQRDMAEDTKLSLWDHLGPSWRQWMVDHVALQSDYIVSSMVAAFAADEFLVVILACIRDRWAVALDLPDAALRSILQDDDVDSNFGFVWRQPTKYIEPNRHCTLFLYLNDVASGGATVFPVAPTTKSATPTEQHYPYSGMPECTSGMAVRPKKGSGVLFYSKLPSGENDPKSVHGGCPPGEGHTKWGSNVFMWNIPSEEAMRLWKFW